MLRIEAGLIFFNYEFTDQTDPFEAGIGFTVPLKSKDEDFVGREALIRRQANPQHELVGLESMPTTRRPRRLRACRPRAGRRRDERRRARRC